MVYWLFQTNITVHKELKPGQEWWPQHNIEGIRGAYIELNMMSRWITMHKKKWNYTFHIFKYLGRDWHLACIWYIVQSGKVPV